MRAIDDRKATLGITESSLARAHIDRVACYLDVGSLHPARAEAGQERYLSRVGFLYLYKPRAVSSPSQSFVVYKIRASGSAIQSDSSLCGQI
ncbi:hypothetical protein ELS20_06160 [Haloarcula hispanica]|uniref:Uncharacterized protein n=1 Tax=Haloarcula hispanica TaxID=51589 RepID=A0A482TAL3_HALHI|nr:hypothetical protein ELS20_06160 [Haloarcula hispanica]